MREPYLPYKIKIPKKYLVYKIKSPKKYLVYKILFVYLQKNY
jgi:hypothetical protein